MTTGYDETTKTAREYYNSKDADEFYYAIWGGEDIHVGLYKSDDEPILDASRRTVERMHELLPPLNESSKVIDLGAGYGGAARYLVKETGCHVTCLNLSETQNQRDREINESMGLSDKITVLDGSFENVPAGDGEFDVVWSEDSFLHSGDRKRVLEEAYRVLKPGGSLIFTDPMQKEDAPASELRPVYDRIHLDSLASFEYYKKTCEEIGFKAEAIEDISHQLTRHYTRVKEELSGRYDEIIQISSKAYVDRMLQGLQHWIDAGTKGYLSWGILHFIKTG